MTVTLRITYGGAGRRAYVLGNGSAFGVETPPVPGGGFSCEDWGLTGC
jgi:hypothetical protein